MRIPEVSSAVPRSTLIDAPAGGPYVLPAGGTELQQAGDTAERGGLALVSVANLMQRRYDESRVREADAKLADADRETLSGPNGYLNQIGRSALDAREATLKQLEDHRQALNGALTSPEQREMFSRVAEARRQRALLAVDTHYAEQLRVDDIAETTARANALMRDAVDTYFLPHPVQDTPGKPDPHQVALAAALDEIKALARKKGLGPDATAEVLTKARTQLQTNIATKLIDGGNYAEALQFIGGTKMIAGDDRSELERRAQTGIAKMQGEQVAQSLALEVAKKSGNLFDGLQGLDAMFAAGKVSAPVYDEARSRLLRHFQDERSAKAAEREDTWTQAQEYFKVHGLILSEELDAKIRHAGLEDRVDDFVRTNGHRVTDQLGHAMLTEESTESLRSKFSTRAELVDAMRPHVTPADMGALVKRWEQGDKDLPQRDTDLILAERLRDVMRLPPGAKLDPELYKRWKDRVAVHARAIMDEKAGATVEQATALGAERAAKEGWWANTRMSEFVPAITATPGQIAGAVVDVNGTPVEAQLELINPDTGLKFKDTIDQQLAAQAMKSEPGKPFGYVRIAERPGSGRVGPQIVPIQTVGLADKVRMSALLIQEYENAGRLSRPPVKSDTGETTSISGMQRQILLNRMLGDAVIFGHAATRDDMLRLVLARRSEWSALGLTEADVRAAVDASKGIK